jgi:hypothetical protein
MNKKEIIAHCILFVENKLADLLLIQSEINASLQSETKSSAGDKHETARSMIQLEQEKLGKQLLDWELIRENILKLNLSDSIINNKNLIETSKGWFFIFCHIGKITINGKNVMAISSASPLGNQLLQQEKGMDLKFNGETYKILGKY